jgi:hypothetical protein
MHAANCFLLSLEGDDPVKDAKSQLNNWANRRCDENNWYKEEVLITRKGDIIQMCEDGDWRGREEVGHYVKANAGSAPFEWARRFTLNCVCTDLDVFDLPRFSIIPPTNEQEAMRKKLDEMSFGDLIQYIDETVPKKLSRIYAEMKRDNPPDDWLADYKRRRMVDTFERYYSTHTKPFSCDGTPYEYRAFDLTGGDDLNEIGDSAAIMIVDIHT